MSLRGCTTLFVPLLDWIWLVRVLKVRNSIKSPKTKVGALSNLLKNHWTTFEYLSFWLVHAENISKDKCHLELTKQVRGFLVAFEYSRGKKASCCSLDKFLRAMKLHLWLSVSWTCVWASLFYAFMSGDARMSLLEVLNTEIIMILEPILAYFSL